MYKRRVKAEQVYIIFLIGIICLWGMFLNLRGSFVKYSYIINKSRWYLHSYFGFANYMYFVLNNSEAINAIKKDIPVDSTIGFYSDLPYGYEFMMCAVLQNLLSPILLDRDKPVNYDYEIVFTGKLSSIVDIKRNIKNLGHGLYLVYK